MPCWSRGTPHYEPILSTSTQWGYVCNSWHEMDNGGHSGCSWNSGPWLKTENPGRESAVVCRQAELSTLEYDSGATAFPQPVKSKGNPHNLDNRDITLKTNCV